MISLINTDLNALQAEVIANSRNGLLDDGLCSTLAETCIIFAVQRNIYSQPHETHEWRSRRVCFNTERDCHEAASVSSISQSIRIIAKEWPRYLWSPRRECAGGNQTAVCFNRKANVAHSPLGVYLTRVLRSFIIALSSYLAR